MRNFYNGEMVCVVNYFWYLEEFEFMDIMIVWLGGFVIVLLGRFECGFNGEFCLFLGMMMLIFLV